MSGGAICVQCGAQLAAAQDLPAACPICTDERQFLRPGGQRWTSHAELERDHVNLWRRREPALWGVRTQPRFAIGQEAHLVETPAGNLLWDCLSLIDAASVELVRARGGVACIAISHPHFYASMVEWSRALDDAPIWIHADDSQWVQRPDERVKTWGGDRLPLLGGLEVVRCGGHFDGAAVLHWPEGAEGRGVLLTSDTLQLVAHPDKVSFMYSYPNLIPLSAAAVRTIGSAVERLSFDRIYGSFGGVIEADARRMVRRSVDRYVEIVGP